MTAPENPPAVPTDHRGTPLPDAPLGVLCFALGCAVTQPAYADNWGGLCAVVEELQRRRWPVMGGPQPDVFTTLMGYLPPDLARQVVLLYTAARGQRWAHTGRR